MLFSREKKAQQRRDWDTAKAYSEYIEKFRNEVEHVRIRFKFSFSQYDAGKDRTR